MITYKKKRTSNEQNIVYCIEQWRQQDASENLCPMENVE